jgi:hypothetical protein
MESLDLKWMVQSLKDAGFEYAALYQEWNHNKKQILQITLDFDSFKLSQQSFGNKVLIANNPFVIANYFNDAIFKNCFPSIWTCYKINHPSCFTSNQVGINLFMKKNMINGTKKEMVPYGRKIFVDINEFFQSLEFTDTSTGYEDDELTKLNIKQEVLEQAFTPPLFYQVSCYFVTMLK